MADPVTFLLITSTALGALGLIQGGVQANRAAKYNAAVAKQKGQFEEAAHREAARKLMAKQRAGFAKSGVVISEGTPLAVLEETAAAAELDALALRYGATTSASIFRQEGRAAQTAGMLGAGRTILSGAANVALYKGAGTAPTIKKKGP